MDFEAPKLCCERFRREAFKGKFPNYCILHCISKRKKAMGKCILIKIYYKPRVGISICL